MILQSSAQIFHNGGDTRERGKQITRSLVFHSWCFVPLCRGCQQPDRRSLRVGSWVPIKAGTKSLNAATLQPFKLLLPPPPRDSEQVTARQWICPVHTHAARVASKQQSKFDQPSFPRDSANPNLLSAPRAPPGLNQNERKPRCAAAARGCTTKGGCHTASCGQACAPTPALTAVSFG